MMIKLYDKKKTKNDGNRDIKRDQIINKLKSKQIFQNNINSYEIC